VNYSRKTIDREGSIRRFSSVTGGNPRVNQRDDTPSRGVGGREVNSVRREDVLKCSEVVVGRCANILNTHNVVSFQQGLEVRYDLEVTSNQTTRK
jgi:hypothetical protein